LRPWSTIWQKLGLVQQFLAMTSVAIVLNMLAIGYWAESRIFENAVSTMAETSAPYLEGALSPHVQSLGASHRLTTEERRRIDDLLRNTQLTERVEIIKIWDVNGELVYSTDDPEGLRGVRPERPKAALLQAAAGEVAVDFRGHDAGWAASRPKRVEIYAPIYRTGTRTPIAVGEFYENIEFLESMIAHHRSTMWLSVAVFTLAIMTLIYLIVSRAGRTIQRQQLALRAHLETASRLARRSDRLRRIADKARLNAAVANETYLAGIGADLHDGPLQILGLAMLKLDGSPAVSEPAANVWRNGIGGLLREAIQDLRTLASGLVLPEITTITLDETIKLAVERHELFTATSVLCSVGPLSPDASVALKLCAYRVVQESLNNSYRHAAGRGQSVIAYVSGAFLEIRVGDRGDGIAWIHAGERATLGIRGLVNRVKSLRGSIAISSEQGVGTEVRVRIPLQPNLTN
jgi:signal transduction histidine kinase